MVYTITLNPAFDYIMCPDGLEEGRLCRSSQETIRCGGKGVNVSVMLTRLGVQNTALGIAAGDSGEIFCRKLSALGVAEKFTRVEKGEIRINVKLEQSTAVTEINACGPHIGLDASEKFLSAFGDTELGAEDYIVIAGSLPEVEDKQIYEKIMTTAQKKNAEVVLDVSGGFSELLPLKPFLIKPNSAEAALITGAEPANFRDAVKAALKIQDLGARNVIVSLGKTGAVLLTENGKVLRRKAPAGRAINTVGAGDSMIAGFLAEYTVSGNFESAFNFAIAAGSATAFSPHLAEYTDVISLYKRIKGDIQ